MSNYEDILKNMLENTSVSNKKDITKNSVALVDEKGFMYFRHYNTWGDFYEYADDNEYYLEDCEKLKELQKTIKEISNYMGKFFDRYKNKEGVFIVSPSKMCNTSNLAIRLVDSIAYCNIWIDRFTENLECEVVKRKMREYYNKKEGNDN